MCSRTNAWSTGILIHGCQVPEGGIDLMNRGEIGLRPRMDHGWGVAWNNVAKSYVIQMPPGSANWAIGNRGDQQLGRMHIQPRSRTSAVAAGNRRVTRNSGQPCQPLLGTITRSSRVAGGQKHRV